MSSKTNKPEQLFIGFMPGVALKDAESYARGLITQYAHEPENCYYRAFNTEEGVAWEVQEGGSGRALLPAALKLLRERESVTLPTGTRAVRLQRSEAGEVRALMLPEGEAADLDPDELGRGPKLKPFEKLYRGWVNLGGAVLSVGVVALISAIILHSFLERIEVSRDRAVAVEKSQALPMSRFPSAPEDQYVVRHEYIEGTWRPVVYERVEPLGPERPDAVPAAALSERLEAAELEPEADWRFEATVTDGEATGPGWVRALEGEGEAVCEGIEAIEAEAEIGCVEAPDGRYVYQRVDEDADAEAAIVDQASEIMEERP